ncbi:c-type cytochrome [Rhodovulum adriaticum]|uniref:Cytochrome c n=1 Tax=Rhodovulum adriaticum TaxID=35804 RepID=A0A4R2P0B8_RHOAD|nr:cytochrome c family protein [Rhodovulum adriaticum]MBK1636115.1 hypothetical protein [Rhodovulum adriaticum]TCP27498.1 cytochrome c [Rhodovulum adriaticum]
MANTPSFTKLAATASAALVALVFINMAGKALYTKPELESPAYVILEETDDTETAAAEPEVELTFEELLAQADVDAGARVFKECRACHKVEEGVHAVGPSLYGVVGRAVASFDDFNYSGALDGTAEVWTPQAISEFITNPREYAPGTAMTYNGLRDAEDRANVIAYLQSVDG